MPIDAGRIGGAIVVPPISQFKVPLPFWQRLEPRGRTDNFARSIQAQIHGGPLWILARQLQFGEFLGDDAGSIVNATIETKVTKLTHVRLGASDASPVHLLSPDVPLETVIEREFPTRLDWRSAVRIGQQFERELRELWKQGRVTEREHNDIIAAFKRRYALNAAEGEGLLELDDPTREFLGAVAGRVIDERAMVSAGLIAENPVVPVDLGLPDRLTSPVQDALKGVFEWRRLLYGDVREGASKAWQHNRLEYEFHVSAPHPQEDREIVLVTPEYDGRLLDWPDFSVHPDREARLAGAGGLGGAGEATEFIPTPMFFRGMPNHRWWEFEDRQIDFGDLEVNTTDLGKLLLMEFALIHGNDWFLFPLPLEVGSLCFIQKLTVADVFGQKTVIQRAGSGQAERWQGWDMFRLTLENAAASDEDARRNDFLFLPPTLTRSDQSPALEELVFLRDEMANMVWAVERTILNGLGEPLSGYEAYRGRLRRLKEHADRERAERARAAADEIGELAAEAAAAAAAASDATTPEAVASHTEAAEEALRRLDERARRAADEMGERAQPPEQAASIPVAYRLSNIVPENWIPYVAFHTRNSRRAIELRPASMVRNQEDLQPVPIRPMSYLLADGPGHRLNEETVSRAAKRLRLTVQRARWIDGSTHLWVGRNVGPGGGEASSGLKFDLVVDK